MHGTCSLLPFRLMMRFTTRKESDGKFHFKTWSNTHYKPYSNSHYNGRIYIIQGGYTFSAASMFVLQLKGQQNVNVVGEETGGGNYGTSACTCLLSFYLGQNKSVAAIISGGA